MGNRLSATLCIVIVVFFHIATASRSKSLTEKCIVDLGCFSSGGAFYSALFRPFSVVPDDREKINTTFWLFTRDNPFYPQRLRNSKRFRFKSTYFDPKNETKIIIHGFNSNSNVEWVKAMKEALLRYCNCNVITVDWRDGARFPLYNQATANARVVGAEIALLVARLMNQTGARLNRFHFIGHSLGAHAAGYAGKRLDKPRRITGLDPAGPYFEGMPPETRLHRGDAQFVDAIHTDAGSLATLSFGIRSPVGDVDFYPNNGKDQPGCSRGLKRPMPGTTDDTDLMLANLSRRSRGLACRHSRAHEYFLASFAADATKSVAFPCKDWETFSEGQCRSCGPRGHACAVMGILAEKFKPDISGRQAKFFLSTTDEDSRVSRRKIRSTVRIIEIQNGADIGSKSSSNTAGL